MKRLLAFATVSVGVLSGVRADGAPVSPGKVVCGAPHTANETLFLHQQRVSRDHQQRVSRDLNLFRVDQAQASRSRDIGDIAVIEASSDIVAQPHPLDLSNRKVTITPGATSTSVVTEELPLAPAMAQRGVRLDLEDDDYALVRLPFEFPYYGVDHRWMFVHSDGNLTFLYPEATSTPRNYSRAAAGPPRIAPLFRDLDPSQGGRMSLYSMGDRVIVTWYRVPVFVDEGEPPGAPQTVQVTLRDSGVIEFRYGVVNAPDAVVGTLPGDAARAAAAVDWSTKTRQTFDRSSILAEVFSDERTLDEFAVSHAFFRNHEDTYDALIVFNDLDFDASEFSLAHAYPVRNEVQGIGERSLDTGTYFGSSRRLSSFVNMGEVDNYSAQPLAPLPGLPHGSMLTILAHEVGHRYLAYAAFEDPATGGLSTAILGRQLAHWSFFFHTSASVLEGNSIKDHGSAANPRFETIAATQAYSPLDQYLMGLRDPSEVPAMFLVENPSGTTRLGNSARPPEVGVTFNGERKEVLVEHIIAQMGARRPDATVAQRHFRHAFVLLVDDLDSPNQQVLGKLQRLQRAWRTFTDVQLGSRADFSSGLVKMLHLSPWPAGGLIANSAGTGRIEISEARQTDLTVTLTEADGIASVPATVTIPAGKTSADFEMRGLKAGVTSLTAEAGSDPGYANAISRFAVRTSAAGLTLEREHRPTVYGVAAEPAQSELTYRVLDENFVPYSGVELAFQAVGSGAPAVPNACTGPDGRVSVRWELGSAPGTQTLVARLSADPTSIDTTEARVSSHRPAFAASGLVNAASRSAPGAGRGFAPGSLVTINGQGLALEAVSADTLLAFPSPSLPEELGGTSVYMAGLAMPIVSVSPTQVTFQISFEVPEGLTNLAVSTSYGSTQSVPIRVSPAQPGIFASRVRAGTHDAVIGSMPEAGALPRAGGLLEVFATGLGAVDPPGRTGLPGLAVPAQSVVAETQAWVDDKSVDVTFSGLAPLETGIYRVVIELPETLAAGEHSVKVAVGGVESNSVTFKSQ